MDIGLPLYAEAVADASEKQIPQSRSGRSPRRPPSRSFVMTMNKRFIGTTEVVP